MKKISILVLILLLSMYCFMAEGKSMETNNTAIFAMGCFWCGETEFTHHETHQLLPGIVSLTVGYAGGTIPNPTYHHHPGYQEAVKIVFDPGKITYERLLDIFWHNVDPFDGKGQFCDKGPQYKAVIFYQDDDQKKQAIQSKNTVQKALNQGAIVTEIKPLTTFYAAEDYHQHYAEKNPIRYYYYRWRCGRDKRLNDIWAKP